MAVLIKEMAIPKNGYDCPLCNDGMCPVAPEDSDGICLVFGPGDENRPNWCPLIEIPESKADIKLLEDAGFEL